MPKKPVSFRPGGANWDGGGDIRSPAGVPGPCATTLSLLWLYEKLSGVVPTRLGLNMGLRWACTPVSSVKMLASEAASPLGP